MLLGRVQRCVGETVVPQQFPVRPGRDGDADGHGDPRSLAGRQLQLRYGEENADWVALFYACRHDNNDAIRWLRTYLARHKRLLGYQPYLMNCFNNLAEEPRYQEIRRQIK